MSDRDEAGAGVGPPAEPGAPADLEIPWDPAWQARAWRFERLGWALFLIVVALGLVGLLGDGGLSQAEARSPDGRLRIRYPQIVRNLTEAVIVVEARPAAPDPTVELAIEHRWLAAADLVAVMPAPLRMVADGGGVTLVFARRPGPAPLVVTLDVRMRAPGRQRGHLSLPGGPAVAVARWVLP